MDEDDYVTLCDADGVMVMVIVSVMVMLVMAMLMLMMLLLLLLMMMMMMTTTTTTMMTAKCKILQNFDSARILMVVLDFGDSIADADANAHSDGNDAPSYQSGQHESAEPLPSLTIFKIINNWPMLQHPSLSHVPHVPTKKLLAILFCCDRTSLTSLTVGVVVSP